MNANVHQKGKIFGIFNIVDLAILFVVLAAVFGFVVKSGILQKVSLSNNEIPITVTYKIGGVTADNAAGYQKDALLINTETGASLGTITEVKRMQAYGTMRKTDGTVVNAPMARTYDVYVTAQGVGTYSELGHFINGSRHVAPGSTVKVNTLYSQGMATVISVASEKNK